MVPVIKFSPPFGFNTIKAPLIIKTLLLTSKVETSRASVTLTIELTEETFGTFHEKVPDTVLYEVAIDDQVAPLSNE